MVTSPDRVKQNQALMSGVTLSEAEVIALWKELTRLVAVHSRIWLSDTGAE